MEILKEEGVFYINYIIVWSMNPKRFNEDMIDITIELKTQQQRAR